jgi:DNA-directed RNA polymerase alpha subunit
MSNVNHPKHYSLDIHCECGKNIECLDIVKNLPFVDGNIIKYVWRWRQKNGVEDLLKAKFYLNELIKSAQETKLKINRSTSVYDLNLNQRTRNCLLSEKINTIEDIMTYSKNHPHKGGLKRVPNLGIKSYKLLQDELAKYGFEIG